MDKTINNICSRPHFNYNLHREGYSKEKNSDEPPHHKPPPFLYDRRHSFNKKRKRKATLLTTRRRWYVPLLSPLIISEPKNYSFNYFPWKFYLWISSNRQKAPLSHGQAVCPSDMLKCIVKYTYKIYTVNERKSTVNVLVSVGEKTTLVYWDFLRDRGLKPTKAPCKLPYSSLLKSAVPANARQLYLSYNISVYRVGTSILASNTLV